uniref:HEAT repeat-containing protein 1 n=1 Tax=Timema douglasi TaxID=61478 RepID=A0A7R8ZDC5_TIMDO|nr:unnamed protein product [Timema douglasi]
MHRLLISDRWFKPRVGCHFLTSAVTCPMLGANCNVHVGTAPRCDVNCDVLKLDAPYGDVNCLLPGEMVIPVVRRLLDNKLSTVRRKTMELLNNHLQHQADSSSKCDPESYFNLLPPLMAVVGTIGAEGKSQEGELELNQQTALLSLKLMARFLGLEHPTRFQESSDSGSSSSPVSTESLAHKDILPSGDLAGYSKSLSVSLEIAKPQKEAVAKTSHQKMLNYVRGAQKCHHEYLEMKKQESSEEDKKKAEKRKLDIQCVEVMAKMLKNDIPQGNVLASMVLCIADMTTSLKANIIISIALIMPALINILKKHQTLESPSLMMLSIITAIHKIVENLTKFLSPYIHNLLREICALSAKWVNDTDPKIAPIVHKLQLTR